MLARWPIRNKLLLCVAMLFLIVTTLFCSSLRGVYAYRRLARTISQRARELPLAAALTRSVNQLRMTVSRVSPLGVLPPTVQNDPLAIREQFRDDLREVEETLCDYRVELENSEPADPRMADTNQEWKAVSDIDRSLAQIRQLHEEADWALDQVQVESLRLELDHLNQLVEELPTYLQTRMHDFSGQVRVEYRTMIVLNWLTSLTAGSFLLLLAGLFHGWIFRPLRVLIAGSRRVARGDFQHRIAINTHDEVAELAQAMNDMTFRFQTIRDDLDRQVKLRTREVVRSEQLASVGYLAAGVAHEINNPLASIAWSAEALESRLQDLLQQDQAELEPQQAQEIEILRKYLRRIQDEAFRCKGITERLLDFSRLGGVERQPVDLRELVEGVLDLVKHQGRYRNKHILLAPGLPVRVSANPQEIKQVVLNLVINALDSLDSDGTVSIALTPQGEQAELLVSDNGCGMSEEVLEHLFEPFFTRRRDGQGTGLGLSITYRIVNEHGGVIEASSAGVGKGSQFRVTLPLVKAHEKDTKRQQAA